MHEVNLRAIDLNLLVILQHILREQHVTRAAEQLNMSQPAVSRALQRLRGLFADPLLVPTQNGYALSARATAVQAKLDVVLQGVSHLIAPPVFDPATAQDTVAIYGADPDTALIVPSLLAHVSEVAPGLRLSVHGAPQDFFVEMEKEGAHFLISGIQPERFTDHFRRIKLFDFEIVALMRQKHPLAVGPVTLERLACSRHGYVSLTGRGPGMLEKLFARHDLSVHSAVRLTSFTGVADYCEQGNVVFYLPRLYAEKISVGRPLVLRDMPSEVMFGRDGVYLYWHERYHNDPMCIWMRENIQSVARALNSRH